ncbi:MAG TPA: hypothetical protein VNM47_11875 [Terriglobia bacterium]|nr:hypothetical protein [Terriglobia bacterium]
MRIWKTYLKWVVPCLVLVPTLAVARSSPQNTANGQKVRPIGVVTEVQPGQLTLRTDAGPSLTVSLPEDVSVLQVPPGAKSLKQANKITVGDVHLGDRVLILGPVSEDQKSVSAKTVLVMSKTALEIARDAERLQWEKNGIAGVVKAVDPAAKEITLAVPNTPPKPGNLTHSVIITLAPSASLLRYAPDSVKFSDAKPAPFDQIKVDDQIRALGTKSADGTRFTARKLVSGTFRNIGATVISVDTTQGTITIKDLATGTPVLVRTNAESKLHQLTPDVANTIATFNAGSPEKGSEGQQEGSQGGERPRRAGFQGNGRPGGPGEGGRSGMQRGRSDNFEQMLQQMPALSLSELKAGEPLIVVSTEGAKPDQVTAIAVLSGVEPILRARPKGSKEVALGPWNMSVGGGGGEEAGGQGGEGGGSTSGP